MPKRSPALTPHQAHIGVQQVFLHFADSRGTLGWDFQGHLRVSSTQPHFTHGETCVPISLWVTLLTSLPGPTCVRPPVLAAGLCKDSFKTGSRSPLPFPPTLGVFASYTKKAGMAAAPGCWCQPKTSRVRQERRPAARPRRERPCLPVVQVLAALGAVPLHPSPSGPLQLIIHPFLCVENGSLARAAPSRLPPGRFVLSQPRSSGRFLPLQWGRSATGWLDPAQGNDFRATFVSPLVSVPALGRVSL